MSWWTENTWFKADTDKYGYPTGTITFPSSVMVETDGNDLCYDIGLNVSQWARENGKPFYKKSLAFKRIDLTMEVDVLSADYLIPENLGKVYKWNGKLWELQMNEYGAIFFKDFMETPTELFEVGVNTLPGEYDITNYATLRVLIRDA